MIALRMMIIPTMIQSKMKPDATTIIILPIEIDSQLRYIVA